ncbi:MAG: hypothetical protein IJ600_04775 [Lachnospiraceae bacterium]|nr:hypothetical protein [Lachnospiraceae bacterium]
MKDVKVTIGAVNIKSLKYDNSFNKKPGEPMKLAVKTQVGVSLNPSAPTAAMVMVKFEIGDEEKKTLSMEMEAWTPVSVSTFVDNLDEMIKKNYINDVMLAVNEKIRIVTSIMGLSLQTPNISFAYRDGQDSIDTEIYTKF